jgi:ParB family chromosome partitioning protein
MVSKFQLNTAKSIEAKEAISRTLEIANSYAGELAIEVLPLNKIELDPENKRELILTLQDATHGIDKDDPDLERKKEDWKSLESLAKTIQNDQLINPIFVYRYGNKCRLIAGERRTLASAIAGKKEIIARIASQRPVGTRLRVLQWVENNERSELSLSERIASLEAIFQENFLEHPENVDNTRVSAKLLSELTGISLTQARRYTLILQAPSEIRLAINQGQLENLKLAELICSAKTKEQQQELLSAALSDKSYEYISKMKKEMELSHRKIITKKGRKKIHVSLGNVKPDVAKTIIEVLLATLASEYKNRRELKNINQNIQWGDNDAVAKLFQEVASLLEGGINHYHEQTDIN